MSMIDALRDRLALRDSSPAHTVTAHVSEIRTDGKTVSVVFLLPTGERVTSWFDIPTRMDKDNEFLRFCRNNGVDIAAITALQGQTIELTPDCDPANGQSPGVRALVAGIPREDLRKAFTAGLPMDLESMTVRRIAEELDVDRAQARRLAREEPHIGKAGKDAGDPREAKQPIEADESH